MAVSSEVADQQEEGCHPSHPSRHPRPALEVVLQASISRRRFLLRFHHHGRPHLLPVLTKDQLVTLFPDPVLTPLPVRHPGWWHSKRIIHRIIVHTPRGISQLALLIIQV